MQDSAVDMQGLLQEKQKVECSVQKGTTELQSAQFVTKGNDNISLSPQHNNPFAVLDLCMEEGDVKPLTTPILQPSSATKRKLKSPLQKLLSPNANTRKGRERISKKHWERELANLKECTTPASDGKQIKKRREARGGDDGESNTRPGLQTRHPTAAFCGAQLRAASTATAAESLPGQATLTPPALVADTAATSPSSQAYGGNLLHIFLSNLQARVQRNPADPQAIHAVAALYHS
ncbi:hypothetical protein AXF42_Ash016867 [Apostasia shenzhenica]|uniref:Uncharacterized protein n=1 Tax=Apostasia shenzhenica TaxID=1088818 RepID=A0A2I0BAM4_9ASPA|nr:hypothetical protein AXF42_Ash016867 [Apostasia shenzhenica]